MSVTMERFENLWAARGTSLGLLTGMTRLVGKMSKTCRTRDPQLFKFIRNASGHEAIRYGRRSVTFILHSHGACYELVKRARSRVNCGMWKGSESSFFFMIDATAFEINRAMRFSLDKAKKTVALA